MEEIIFPPGMPEEFKQQMTSMIQRQNMAVEDFQHRMVGLIDSLNIEQLVTTKMLLMHTAGESAPAHYFIGVISGILHSKHNICFGCEKNHDQVMTDIGMRQTPSDEEAPMDGGDPFKPSERAPTDLKVGQIGMLSVFQMGNMVTYNLDDLREIGTERLLGFKCLGCGMEYSSIEDRMVKPPGEENCPGCVAKTKWG